MPDQVSYVTKVKEISGVRMHGKLDCHRAVDVYEGHYATFVGKDSLDEWLDKFDGMDVYIEIKTMAQDEAHLLPDTVD